METAVEREEKARAAARRDREERRAALGIPPQPEPSPVQVEKEETRPDPADVFRGNITMAGREPSKEDVYKRQVLDFLKKLNREGNTIVMITHDSSIALEAEQMCIRDRPITLMGR